MYFLKTIVKTRFFKPVSIENNGVNILVYELVDEKWSTSNIKSRENLLDKLLVIAQNTLSTLESSGELRDKYVFVEVEYPGLRASRGDGRVEGSEVIVFPIPQPLKTIVFLKKEGNELVEVNKIVFKQEKWIYDSIIRISNMDYDALLVESIENKRIILREELLSPKIYITKGTEKRKRKRKKLKKRRRKKTTREVKKNKKRTRRRRKRRSKHSSRK